jgi:hypothetical protein
MPVLEDKLRHDSVDACLGHPRGLLFSRRAVRLPLKESGD